jgi:hypothetical protein
MRSMAEGWPRGTREVLARPSASCAIHPSTTFHMVPLPISDGEDLKRVAPAGG